MKNQKLKSKKEGWNIFMKLFFNVVILQPPFVTRVDK